MSSAIMSSLHLPARRLRLSKSGSSGPARERQAAAAGLPDRRQSGRTSDCPAPAGKPAEPRRSWHSRLWPSVLALGSPRLVLVDRGVVTSGAAGPVCHCCGQPVPAGNLAWDYPVPDPVAFLSEEELAGRIIFRSQRVISVTGPGQLHLPR